MADQKTPASPTERDLELLRHMLGIDNAETHPPTRNYFAAEPDDVAIARLAAMGLVELTGSKAAIFGDLVFWRCTEQGRAVAIGSRERPPRLRRSQRIYRAWLDCDTADTFKTFLVSPYYAEARREAVRRG